MGGKVPKPPPVPAPQAIPDVDKTVPEEAARRAKSMSSYSKTVMAGSLAPKSSGLRTTLG